MKNLRYFIDLINEAAQGSSAKPASASFYKILLPLTRSEKLRDPQKQFSHDPFMPSQYKDYETVSNNSSRITELLENSGISFEGPHKESDGLRTYYVWAVPVDQVDINNLKNMLIGQGTAVTGPHDRAQF